MMHNFRQIWIYHIKILEATFDLQISKSRFFILIFSDGTEKFESNFDHIIVDLLSSLLGEMLSKLPFIVCFHFYSLQYIDLFNPLEYIQKYLFNKNHFNIKNFKDHEKKTPLSSVETRK